MSTRATIDDRAGAVLAELAEMDLAAARKAHGALMAAEGAEEIDRLGRAYQRLARSTRQSLALAQRFAREDRLEARQAAREAAQAERDDARAGGRLNPSRDPAVAARKAEVREVVTRLVWDEAERSEVAGLLDELEFYLEIESHERRFLEDPTPRIAARLCADLDLELRPADFGPDTTSPPPGAPPAGGAPSSDAPPCSPEAAGGLPDRPG